MIGDDFDPTFTDWLFNEVEDISNRALSHDHDETMVDEAPVAELNSDTSPRRSLKSTPTSARAGASPYPSTSRMVEQINRALERPQIKHSIPDLPNVPTGPRSLSSAGPVRRGRASGRQPALPPMPPNFGAFMMASGVPTDVIQQMMVDAANFPNQVFPGFSQATLADRISDGSSGIVVVGGEKARCRHWPRCQLGNRCKFHHPSQICPYSRPYLQRLMK